MASWEILSLWGFHWKIMGRNGSKWGILRHQLLKKKVVSAPPDPPSALAELFELIQVQTIIAPSLKATNPRVLDIHAKNIPNSCLSRVIWWMEHQEYLKTSASNIPEP